MRLRFINPNSTDSMTDKVREAARSVAPNGLVIEAVTSATGPAAIQGEADGLAAPPGLLHEMHRADADGVDIIALACFDDTGIAEARVATERSVIGIGQCAFLQALALGRRFSVITTLAVSVPVIEANLAYAGIARPATDARKLGCARVRASGVAVLALERDGAEGERARERVAEQIAIALDEDDADAIVLGCAGMADLAQRFSDRFGIPVIDGVVACVNAVALVSRLPDRPESH